MWLESEKWTRVTRASLVADVRALRTELRDWATSAHQLIAQVRNYAEVDPKRRLDEAQLTASENTDRLRDQLPLVALYSVLVKYPALGEELDQLAPGSASDVVRWYRLGFSANGQQHLVFLTRNLPPARVESLRSARAARGSTLTCISYEGEHSRAGSNGAPPRRLRIVAEQDSAEDAKALESALQAALVELGVPAPPAPARAARPRSNPKPRVEVEPEPPAPPAPAPPAPAPMQPPAPAPVPVESVAPPPPAPTVSGPEPFSPWDGFVFPIGQTIRELETELEVEFLSTLADSLKLGDQVADWRKDPTFNIRRTLETALTTVYDADLLVAFARLADYQVRDHRLAEQLYRRAAHDATVSHPAHWFLIRYLLREGRSTQATELAMEEDSASLPGFLRQSVVAYETSKERPDQAQFQRIILDYKPVSGRSLADAATLWHTLFPGPKPDWAKSPLWTLGQARHLERPGDRDRADRDPRDLAAAFYATLLEDKNPASNPPPQDQQPSPDLRGQATVAIGALRGLGRLQPQASQRELWRLWYSRLGTDPEFRKQYLVFLKLSKDPHDTAEAQQLRNEFEASRASTLSVT